MNSPERAENSSVESERKISRAFDMNDYDEYGGH